MRVQLSPRRPRGEHGAVAILTSVLMAGVLLVLAAFTLDFGLAYNSKRRLQTAADAGALAAAQVYGQYLGPCDDQFLADHLAEARTAAETTVEENRPGATPTVEVECVHGSPAVRVVAEASTDSVFGGLVTGADSITTNRAATAMADVPQTVVEGLRPLAICSAQIPDGAYTPDGSSTRVATRLYYPGNGHQPPASCLAGSVPGNWWFVDCPGEEQAGHSGLEQQIEVGCDKPVSVAAPEAAAGSDPDMLARTLEYTCTDAPDDSSSCLSGDPGRDGMNTGAAWQELIDAGEPVPMPVFCVSPQCSESTVTEEGTHAVFPVYKVAVVQICGYHFSGNEKYAPEADAVRGFCTAEEAAYINADTSKDSYLSVVFTTVRSAGSTSDIGLCAIGSNCDGGLRRVVLSE